MEGVELLLKGEGDAESHPFPISAVIGQELVKTAIMVTITNTDIRSLLIWGNPGTAKTSMAGSIRAICPDISSRVGCPFHCEKGSDCPHCEGGEEVMPERPPVDPLPPGLGRASLDALRRADDLRSSFLATMNRGYVILDGVDSFEERTVSELIRLSSGKGNYPFNPRFTVIATYDAGITEPPEYVNLFDVYAATEVIDDLEGRIEITRRGMMHDQDPKEFAAQFSREEGLISERIRKARGALSKTFLTKKAKAHLGNVSTEKDYETIRTVAKTIAALDGKRWASVENVDEAWELVAGSRETLIGGVVRL